VIGNNSSPYKLRNIAGTIVALATVGTMLGACSKSAGAADAAAAGACSGLRTITQNPQAAEGIVTDYQAGKDFLDSVLLEQLDGMDTAAALSKNDGIASDAHAIVTAGRSGDVPATQAALNKFGADCKALGL
jgi:hypothetical protein